MFGLVITLNNPRTGPFILPSFIGRLDSLSTVRQHDAGLVLLSRPAYKMAKL